MTTTTGDSTVETLTWQGCYGDSWRDFITPKSFAHPAKMARGLLTRILTFGLERGFWRPGSIVGDPFAGIASGGLMCAYHGLRWVGVELESSANDPPGSPFVELAQDNIALHRFRLGKLGCPLPVVVQGDSRNFAAIVGQVPVECPRCHGDGGYEPNAMIDCPACEGTGRLPVGQVAAILTSPPWADGCTRTGGEDLRSEGRAKYNAGTIESYGHTEGQIGALPAGDLDAVVTSPPYEGTDIGIPGSVHQGPEKLADGCGDIFKANGGDHKNYGHTAGQIGNEQSGTYWQAVAEVYKQCHLALKPGGYLVVVVKDYVRDKQRVPLCDQTCTLLSALGFNVFLRAHASLTETTQESGLFGEPVVKKTEKKSFFRRLAEKKGSPRIDEEAVIFARKVGALPPGTPPARKED